MSSPDTLRGLLALFVLASAHPASASTLTVFHDSRAVARIDLPSDVKLTIASDTGRRAQASAPARFRGHVDVRMTVRDATLSLQAEDVELTP